MSTQKTRLLEYLQKNRTINPLEAWSQLGIYRLGARVFDLRQDGYAIESGRQKVVNRYGEDCKVAQYRYSEA